MRGEAVNLLWQQRFRGVVPLALHAVSDIGDTLLIRPDEFERRTYQVLQIDKEGTARELFAILVETIHRFDAMSDGRLLLGMTDDDVYLFREARKARFMAERRVAYADISLSPDTGWFVCAFSDHLFSSYALAFGDANGRLGWTKDLDHPIQRVGLAPDGRCLAVALNDGAVLAFDNMRNLLWSSTIGEPPTAIALAAAGHGAVLGSAHGSVVSLGPDGTVRWKSPVGPPVVAVAADREGRWSASLHADEGVHLLVVLGPDGAPVWEHELEARPTGLSLSPNGRYLAVTTTAGTALCFEAEFGLAETRRAGLPALHAAAREASGAADPEKRHATLLALAREHPYDLETARLWLESRGELVSAHRQAARQAADTGDYPAALNALNEAAAVTPWDEALFAERAALREQAIGALAERAAAHEAAYDLEGAGGVWREVLALKPEMEAAREALLRLRRLRAAEFVEEGERRNAEGDLPGALAQWQQAAALDTSPELEERLRRAQVERCLARGIELYDAQRLPEATFQFKKALSLEPGNQTAERYLGYAEGQVADPTIADRFARLE